MTTYSQLSTQQITERFGSYIKAPYSLLRDKSLSSGAIDVFLKLSYSQSNNKFSTLSVFASIFKLDYKLVLKYTKDLTDGEYISDDLIVNKDESFFMMPTSFVLSKDNFRLKFYKIIGILDKSTQTLPAKNSTILKNSGMPKSSFYDLMSTLKLFEFMSDRKVDLISIFSHFKADSKVILRGVEDYKKKKEKYLEKRKTMKATKNIELTIEKVKETIIETKSTSYADLRRKRKDVVSSLNRTRPKHSEGFNSFIKSSLSEIWRCYGKSG